MQASAVLEPAAIAEAKKAEGNAAFAEGCRVLGAAWVCLGCTLRVAQVNGRKRRCTTPRRSRQCRYTTCAWRIAARAFSNSGTTIRCNSRHAT